MNLREQILTAIDPNETDRLAEIDRLAYEQVLAQARSTAGGRCASQRSRRGSTNTTGTAAKINYTFQAFNAMPGGMRTRFWMPAGSNAATLEFEQKLKAFCPIGLDFSISTRVDPASRLTTRTRVGTSSTFGGTVAIS